MENQELFDDYIAGTLTKEECEAFEQLLSTNDDVAQQFHLYLTTIHSLRKEEEQDCMEFGYAMRSMTKEHLQSIVGKSTDKEQGKTIPLRPYTNIGERKIANSKRGENSVELKAKKSFFKRPIVWAAIIIIIALIIGMKQCIA